MVIDIVGSVLSKSTLANQEEWKTLLNSNTSWRLKLNKDFSCCRISFFCLILVGLQSLFRRQNILFLSTNLTTCGLSPLCVWSVWESTVVFLFSMTASQLAARLLAASSTTSALCPHYHADLYFQKYNSLIIPAVIVFVQAAKAGRAFTEKAFMCSAASVHFSFFFPTSSEKERSRSTAVYSSITQGKKASGTQLWILAGLERKSVYEFKNPQKDKIKNK